MLAFSRNAVSTLKLATRLTSFRSLSTDRTKFKVLVVGGGAFISFLARTFHDVHLGTGGLSVAHQIYDRFKDAGKPLNKGDIAIVDNAEHHHYQVRPCPDTNMTCFLNYNLILSWCLARMVKSYVTTFAAVT